VHKLISFAKSIVRIFGFVALSQVLPTNDMLFFACFILVVAEVLGIVEEIGE